MIAAIIGIILIVVAVITWVGHVTLAHAVALLIGAIGALILLGGVVPWDYFRRQ